MQYVVFNVYLCVVCKVVWVINSKYWVVCTVMFILSCMEYVVYCMYCAVCSIDV